MMEKNLTVGGIISNGFSIGIKNALSVIGAIILWLLTIWIPYLNVGTTIAIYALPLEMSKGKVMSPTRIFDGKYRKYMGEAFLLYGLMQLGVIMGIAFLVIPGIVISIAWSLSLLLLIDKGLSPLEAMTRSNKLTYGHKWTIFGGTFLLSLILMVAILIISGIFTAMGDTGAVIGSVLSFIIILLFMPILLGANAYIYRVLALEDSEQPEEERDETSGN